MCVSVFCVCVSVSCVYVCMCAYVCACVHACKHVYTFIWDSVLNTSVCVVLIGPGWR